MSSTDTAAAPTLGLRQQLLAELLGTGALVCAVIGSGIMAQRLSGGNDGVALLANTLATMFALYVLIDTLRPVSGAHLNPVVTMILLSCMHASRMHRLRLMALYIAAQLVGAVAGAALANAMFELQPLHWSQHMRGGQGQWLAEVVATAGLVFTILRAPPSKVGALVACYIGAAYWFTSSTSFANPAVVLGRMFSDTFAGIAPASALGFVAAQLLGALLGERLAWALAPRSA